MNKEEISEGDIFTNGRKSVVVRRNDQGLLFAFTLEGKEFSHIEYLLNPDKRFRKVDNLSE